MLIDLQIFVQRALASLLLGTLIGIERQFRQCTTGLRTNALVSLGSAIFVMTLGFDSAVIMHQGRAVAQIISGIGFVGAGVIMKDGAKVRGLSTAVTLWCSAAIGCMCGVGEAIIACAGTCLILMANIVLKKISRRINKYVMLKQAQQQLPVSSRAFVSRVELAGQEEIDSLSPDVEDASSDQPFHYQLMMVCRKREETALRRLLMGLLNDASLIVPALHTATDDQDANRVELCADLMAYSPQQLQLEKIVSRMSIERGVRSVSWGVQAASEEES
jgi:putative Mg2+ transporter-C (MgtC) family protein